MWLSAEAQQAKALNKVVKDVSRFLEFSAKGLGTGGHWSVRTSVLAEAADHPISHRNKTQRISNWKSACGKCALSSALFRRVEVPLALK
jgi:hypothetical protein